MPTTNYSIDTVASLLVTIHQDERGVFSTSVEALPPNPDMARVASLPAYASELLVESDTVASPTRQGARATRWRRRLIATGAVAALVGAVVALHPSSGSSDPLSSPAPTVPTAPAKAFTPSSASCAEPAGSACINTNTILPGLDAACADLLTTAARALDEDPRQWVQGVLVKMVHTGRPLAEVIRQWLASTRADVLATRYADVNLERILQGIDSAIAQADTGACAPQAESVTPSPTFSVGGARCPSSPATRCGI